MPTLERCKCNSFKLHPCFRWVFGFLSSTIAFTFQVNYACISYIWKLVYVCLMICYSWVHEPKTFSLKRAKRIRAQAFPCTKVRRISLDNTELPCSIKRAGRCKKKPVPRELEQKFPSSAYAIVPSEGDRYDPAFPLHVVVSSSFSFYFTLTRVPSFVRRKNEGGEIARKQSRKSKGTPESKATPAIV